MWHTPIKPTYSDASQVSVIAILVYSENQTQFSHTFMEYALLTMLCTQVRCYILVMLHCMCYISYIICYMLNILYTLYIHGVRFIDHAGQTGGVYVIYRMLMLYMLLMLYIVCCILYIVYCILYIVYCILYIVYCILYIVYCILYIVYCILYIVYCILYIVYCILYMYY
jgi:hypothetical protein